MEGIRTVASPHVPPGTVFAISEPPRRRLRIFGNEVAKQLVELYWCGRKLQGNDGKITDVTP